MKTSLRVVDERWRHRDVVATYAKGRHAGALGTAAWLSGRGLLVPPRTEWEVSIELDAIDGEAPAAADTRFHIALSSREWGFYFCHQNRASWIRVTDVPFVQERDDFMLLVKVPPLRDLGSLLRSLERTYCVRFPREHAAIRTTIPGSEPVIREWLVTALSAPRHLAPWPEDPAGPDRG